MSHSPDEIYAEHFLRIYHETITPLYRYVSKRCGGQRELAEDITQETFLRAVNQWRDRRLPDRPIAWLQHVARNLIINHQDRRSATSIDPALLDQILAPGTATNGEAAALVKEGLARLGGRSAKLLEAYYVDGKVVRTIAEEMNLSERAVEGRLRRGRKALRRQITSHVDFSGGTQ